VSVYPVEQLTKFELVVNLKTAKPRNSRCQRSSEIWAQFFVAR
jgi:hypothetical protein